MTTRKTARSGAAAALLAALACGAGACAGPSAAVPTRADLAATTAALDRGAPPELTTILLIRHAERDTMWLGTDMPLRAAGERRARELARVLEEAGVTAIYVTKWRRNRETALPLAAALGESLRVLEGRDFEAQARTLRAHEGETIAVIGHSDTVPQLHEALTGAPWRGYRGGEWDVFLVLTLGPGGAWKTVPIKYGEAARGRDGG